MTASVVAVTGATGAAGRPLVQALRKRGHRVVPISRSNGVDVVSGAGLVSALDGVGTLVDVCSVVTTRRREAITFFRRSTENLLAAELQAGVGHHVVLSIVGIDDVDYAYYAGKRVQEALVTAADVPHTIIRATQFHEFAGQMLERMRFGPVVFVPQLLCSPVSAAEVAEYLAQVVETGPPATAGADGPAEIAGPESTSLFDMVRAFQRRLGDHHLAISVPVPGRAGQLMRSGGLLPRRPTCRRGSVTFEAWLENLDVAPADRGPGGTTHIGRRPAASEGTDMANRIVSLVIDCADPQRLSGFWSRALGWEITARGWQRTPGGPSGATITAPGPCAVEIDFRWVPDRPKTAKNRLHLDLNPTDRDQADELDRLLALGARPVDVGQRKVTWQVLADPEGNEFCLCRDRVDA